MKEINAYTAEVFRRSEQRIRQRKRTRNRLFALCIPFCLIALVSSALLLPGKMRTKNESAESHLSGVDQELASPYAAVMILGDDAHSEKVTEQAAVAKAFAEIHSLFAAVDAADQNADVNFVAEDKNGEDARPDSISKGNGYTIIFTTEAGTETVYTLSGNMLLNNETNETIFLSDAQLARLMTALGISE